MSKIPERTPEETERLHKSVLRVLDVNATRFGLGAAALSVLLEPFGFADTQREEIERVMDYLGDAENRMVDCVGKGAMNPALRTWKITARGTNYLRERGL